ncbi:MAG: 7-carboxy-7-deazaguanine synthase QueE [Verrucomicrobiales bacterium]
MLLSRLPDGSPEIFHTLQGEGPSLGRPAVFLRLSQCNLHCSWCDTPYTWNWEKTPWEHEDGRKFSKSEQSLALSPAEVAPLIDRHGCPLLVITGGEPLLQQAELLQLLPLLRQVREIEFETNGTQIPTAELDALTTRYNVSPKLANSGMAEATRLREKALAHFVSNSKASFKFVVQNEADLREIREIQDRFHLPTERITLMPEGRSPALLRQRAQWLAERCIQHGYRFSPRLHVQLWGDERGR